MFQFFEMLFSVPLRDLGTPGINMVFVFSFTAPSVAHNKSTLLRVSMYFFQTQPAFPVPFFFVPFEPRESMVRRRSATFTARFFLVARHAIHAFPRDAML